jgi:hypothetical protein
MKVFESNLPKPPRGATPSQVSPELSNLVDRIPLLPPPSPTSQAMTQNVIRVYHVQDKPKKNP